MEESLIKRLESAVTRLESLSDGLRSGASAATGGDAASDPSVVAFEDLMSEYVGRILRAAETIGGEVFDVTRVLEEGFSVQKDLIIQMKQSQKPDMAGLCAFLGPLNQVITKANEMTGGKRSDFFNHLKTVAESMSALAWIAYTGKDCGMSMPIAHVEESWQSAEFYNNKVLVEYRNKDPNHVEWAKAMKDLFTPGLRDYVKAHYALGPVWSATGKTIQSAPKSSPAPPPAPSASLANSGTSKPSSSNSAGMSAVFNDISSGNVTAGLRKVTDDMKTKNRADRAGSVTTTEKESRPKSFSSAKTGPPKLELQMGRKWVVENQTGVKDLAIDDCDAKQTVYIFNCKDSVLQIKGKANNITIDKCNKMGVVFEDVVAACEIVNCNRLEVQCQGTAPTISIDNTTGCQVYLSKDSLGSSITTAKSSEVNMLVPGASPEDDMVEHPLPQQYMHVFQDGQFVTSPVSHSGA
ncbi:hypothetical protein ACET3Z_030494 [Daucus carota]